MKRSKGFSLVELLVVVAIIGIISGVGVAGYQQYTDAAKQRLADTNYRNVVEYIKVELAVLNNAILRESPTAKVGNDYWTMGTHNLNQFLNGAAAYHDLGTGLANFKNPFKNSDKRQVFSASNSADVSDPDYEKKGTIVLKVDPLYPSEGAAISGDRRFQIIYYSADNQADPTKTSNMTLK